MVRKSRNPDSVLRLAMFVAVMAVFVGCSETKPRKAGRDLFEKVEVSRRQYNKALSLLEAPVFAPSAVDRKVFDVLKEARDELSKSLKANNDADAPTRSLAESMLGRIDSLRGRCHAHVAEVRRISAHKGLDELGRLDFVLREQIARAGRYKFALEQGNRTNEELVLVVREVEKEIADLTVRRDDCDRRIGKLQERRAALVNANNALAKESRELRAKARDPLTSTDEARELDKARLAKVEDANRNAGEIATIENTIESVSRGRGDVAMFLAAAQGRRDAVEEILKARRKMLEGDPDPAGEPEKEEDKQSSVVEGLKKLQAAMARTQEEIKAGAAAVVEAVGKADEEDELAKKAFDRAIVALEKASKLEKPRRPETLAVWGDQHVALAEMTARKLRLQRRASQLAESVEKTWKRTTVPPPADLKKFGQFVPQPDESLKDALAMYTQAADLYRKAVTAAPRNLEWTYWFMKADAHIGVYQLSNDDQARDDAIEAIEAASKGKEYSPYIKTNAAERRERLGL